MCDDDSDSPALEQEAKAFNSAKRRILSRVELERLLAKYNLEPDELRVHFPTLEKLHKFYDELCQSKKLGTTLSGVKSLKKLVLCDSAEDDSNPEEADNSELTTTEIGLVGEIRNRRATSAKKKRIRLISAFSEDQSLKELEGAKEEFEKLGDTLPVGYKIDYEEAMRQIREGLAS